MKEMEEKKLNEGSKVLRIKSHSAPVFVPLTDELRALPIQEGKWYVCINSSKVVVPTILDSDYDSKELFDEYLRQFTHVAIINKPKELPKEVDAHMVWTEAQEKERAEYDLPIGATFEYGGLTYKVARSRTLIHCDDCAFNGSLRDCPPMYKCLHFLRMDGNSVCFQLVKKGGER